MYQRNTSYEKVYVALLFVVVCISGAFATPCPNCARWENQSFHDAQATRGGRCKTGTIPKGCVPSFNKSEDFCLRCRVTVARNTPSGYRRCPKCFGKAEIRDKKQDLETEEKTDSLEANPVQEEKEVTPAYKPLVVYTEVKKCDQCDEAGKVSPVSKCDLCDKGFNHIKEGSSYKCRVCGKACDSRFAPCCKPDCPKCGKNAGVKINCPICGGDKVITPMEEARNKERLSPVAAK